MLIKDPSCLFAFDGGISTGLTGRSWKMELYSPASSEEGCACEAHGKAAQG